MEPDSSLRRVLRWTGGLIAFWSAPAMISTSLIYAMGKESFLRSTLSQFPPWMFWAAVTVPILLLGRAFPLDRSHWKKSLPIHLVATAASSAGCMIVAGWVSTALAMHYVHEKSFWKEVWDLFSYYAELNVVTYWGILATGQAVDYYRRFREEEVHAERLKTALAQAQLEQLRSQLHPHFLFNTLHAIGVMVRKGDQQGSIRMLTAVSDLLRLALEGAGRPERSLKEELDFVDRYLEVERTRFQDRLKAVRAVGPETLEAEVPSMLLQPVVENAIRHGIEPRSGGGTVTISARREGDQLLLSLKDDGSGFTTPTSRPGAGVGLANLRNRLERLFPGGHRLETVTPEDGGAEVRISLPFRSAHGL